MRKRKERVEKWREEQRKKAMENIGELKKEIEEMKQGKKWSLEDDDGAAGRAVGALLRVVLILTLCSYPLSNGGLEPALCACLADAPTPVTSLVLL